MSRAATIETTAAAAMGYRARRQLADSLEAYVVDRWRLAPTGRWSTAGSTSLPAVTSGPRTRRPEASATRRTTLVVQSTPGTHLFHGRAQRGVRQREPAVRAAHHLRDGGRRARLAMSRSMRCTAPSTRWACARHRVRARVRLALGRLRVLRADPRRDPVRRRPRGARQQPHDQHRPDDARRHRGAGRRELRAGGQRPAPPRTLVSLTLNEFSFDSDPVYGDNDLPARAGVCRARRGDVPTMPRLLRRADLRPGRRAISWTSANTYAEDSYGLLGLRAGYSSEGGSCRRGEEPAG